VHHDDQAVIEAGYKPQLKRTLGFFSAFAMSFSYMSVLMGMFVNYGFVLRKAGPFGVWTWLLVAAGQFLVALVFAEMAGRIPLTGAIYNWNRRLANPTVGWFTAWMVFFAYSIGNVGVVVAMMGPLQSLSGLTFSTLDVHCAGVAIITVQTLVNIHGVRLAAHTNRLAVGAEMVAIIIFGLILLAVVLADGEANTAALTSIPSGTAPYWSSFLMASLMGAWTIVGFETPVDVSEETVNVRRVTARSIILSVVATAILGTFFISIVTLAIPNVAAITAVPDPISAIIAYHLGAAATKVFLFFVVLAMFAASMIGITFAARLFFAVGRDQGVIGSSRLAKVSSYGVLHIASVLVAGIEITALLSASSMTSLYAAPVILLELAYLVTIISFITGVKKLPPTHQFSLGSWHWPVVTLAMVWLISIIAILTLPAEFHEAAKIAVGVLVTGLAIYLVAGRKLRRFELPS
jgi:amino acid transporter